MECKFTEDARPNTNQPRGLRAALKNAQETNGRLARVKMTVAEEPDLVKVNRKTLLSWFKSMLLPFGSAPRLQKL